MLPCAGPSRPTSAIRADSILQALGLLQLLPYPHVLATLRVTQAVCRFDWEPFLPALMTRGGGVKKWAVFDEHYAQKRIFSHVGGEVAVRENLLRRVRERANQTNVYQQDVQVEVNRARKQKHFVPTGRTIF